MRLKDCYDKGLLRRRRADIDKSTRAMVMARADLNRAYELMSSGDDAESSHSRAVKFVDRIQDNASRA
jgi:hypothetical protein